MNDDNFDYVKYLLDQVSKYYYVNFKKDNPVVNVDKVRNFMSYADDKFKRIKEVL